MTPCKCGSMAINPRLHGRDNTDLDLCDVCYWRKRADQKWQPIDTAPKDKRVLLLSESGEVYAGHWGENTDTGNGAWIIAEWGEDSDQALLKTATRWQPAPKG